MKKNQVEVDGKNKLILMIQDVSIKMKLEKEQLKNDRKKEMTTFMQTELKEVFMR